MSLYDLFFECLTIKYKQVGVSANYATRRENDTLYIYFQDSNGVNDWLRNLDFPAKAYKRMGRTVWFAHRGFLKVWKEIEPYLKDMIKDKTIKNIIITGYSHGAGVSVLCYEYIWFNRPDLRNNIFGYGFGCPRVIFGVPYKKLKERWKSFLVIRNINDIVTHLPPFLFGFFHVGKMLKIGAKGKYNPIDAHREKNILKELFKAKP